MIRRYEDADLDDLLEAWEAASRLAHPFLDEDFLAAERRRIPDIHLKMADTWVVVVEGRVVGFVALLESLIGGLFVHPDHHGRGLGHALLEHARGLHGELVVDVFEENEIGRRFYDRCGFELVERTTHEPTGHELLRLRLAPR